MCQGIRDQIANICWIIKKAKEFQKKSTSALLTTQNLWLCGSQQTVENSSRGENAGEVKLSYTAGKNVKLYNHFGK